MAVLFWYLVKCDLTSVRVYSSLHWTSHFHKVPENHGHVYLVGLQINEYVTIQGDQLYIVVFYLYLVKSDLSIARYCTVAYTSTATGGAAPQ